MPTSVSLYKIFLGSPGGLDDERSAVRNAVEEVNRAKRHVGLGFCVVEGDKDVAPDVGAYAQDVINKKIVDDAEVFVFVFGTRVGTPTPTAESGTIEEFQRALQIRKANRGGWPKIMVYFSDAPVKPSSVDFEQFLRVQSFREESAKAGVFYYPFDSADRLEDLVRVHLNTVCGEIEAQGLSRDAEGNEDSQPTSVAVVELQDDGSTDLDDDDDLGFYDCLAVADEQMAEITGVLERVTEAVVELGNKMSLRADEIGKAQEVSQTISSKDIKSFIDKAASDMSSFNRRIEGDVENFDSFGKEFVRYTIKAIEIGEEVAGANRFENPQDYEDFLESKRTFGKAIGNLLDGTDSAVTGIDALITSTSKMGRYTKPFNLAKRETALLLTKQRDSILGFKTILEGLLENIE